MSGPTVLPRRASGWRALGWFWGVLLAAAVLGAAVLQLLGPPDRTAPASPSVASAVPSSPLPRVATDASAGAGVQIAPPVPALLEPSQSFPGTFLPRIAADGRRSMQAYARPANVAGDRPRVGLLLAGLGPNATDSQVVISTLPGAISLAFSPYAPRLEDLLQAARAHGHEYLISIPMEPKGYPVNEEGFRSLLVQGDPQLNRQDLEWTLTRIEGYVGATGAFDGLRGELYAEAAPQFGQLQDELNARGLLYVDPRPGQRAPAGVPGRGVDLVVDDPPDAAAMDAALARLETMARAHGSALGLAGPLRPVTMERIAAWANGLQARGIALVPVSALAQAPAGGRPGDHQ